MMKKYMKDMLGLFLLALLGCANSYAQPLPTANTYRDGDRVRKQLIEYKNLGRANSSSHDFNYNIHASVDGTSLGISCYLSHTAKVSYALYTINGSVVTTGTLRDMPAGIHRDIIPVGNVRQGIYILDLQVDGQHYADKVILGK